MRIPTSDGAGQRGTRRHGRGQGTPGSDRGTAGPDADRTAARRDMFAPGYDSSRGGGDPAARGGTRGSSSWYGSAAGGAIGKGPVRGYPPGPGQPPPIYPPGQFAAWNTGQDSRSRQGSQPGPQDGSQPNRGFPGGPRRNVSQPDQAGQQAAQPGETRSRYYEDLSDTDPGYSVLAVSDPAADVTSTQTWHAVADGRSTGTWTAPALPGGGPGGQPGGPGTASGRHGAPPGAARPVVGRPDTASRDTAGPDPSRPRRINAGPARLERVAGAGAPGADRRDANRSVANRSAADRSGPDAAVRAEPGPQARPPRGKNPAGGKSPAGKKRPRKRPASVKLAIFVAVLLVIAAAATLAYTVLRTAHKPTPPSAAPPAQQPSVTPSASSSPSLGPYGHIASRRSDPQPLTIAQLFPASFKIGGQAVTLAASAISAHCGRALSGSNLQSVVSSGGCDQAVRATYLARTQGLMGTVGVLNLSTATNAAKAAKAADGADFINQLKGKSGPTRKIGNGTGIEEALAKGHYLILIWAEYTNLHRPKTAAQRNTVEGFMQQLLQNTANASLTNRMLSGSP